MEEKTILTLNDFNKICRICLICKDEIMTRLNNELINMLEECTSIQETYTKFPQQMCKSCLWQLKTAFEFKQQCAVALNILCRVLFREENSNENILSSENENKIVTEVKIEKIEFSDNKESINDNKDKEQIKLHSIRFTKNEIKDEENYLSDENEIKNVDENNSQISCNEESLESESDNESQTGEQRPRSLSEILVKKYKIYDLKCNICQKELSTRSTLLRHMETHNTERVFKFSCPVCKKGFSDKGNLNKHLNRHEGKADYKCEKCLKSYYELSALAKHAKTRHAAQPIKCSKCSQTFYHRLQLESHEQTHKKKEFICDICGKIFTQKYHLNLHKSTHSEHRPYKCSICDHSFKHKFTLKTHIQLRHIDAERRDICNVCGKLIHPGGMYQHLETHKDETFKCPDCDKIYTNKYVMHTHRKQVHGNGGAPKRHICQFCSKPYPYLSSLRAHINLVHSGPKERIFNCHLCEKSYTRQALVNAHIRRAHVSEKTHKCPTCDKAFYTKSEWKKHNRSHTGERPFPCAICGKSFGFRNVLNTHLKIHT